jgi:hypothetical protein
MTGMWGGEKDDLCGSGRGVLLFLLVVQHRKRSRWTLTARRWSTRWAADFEVDRVDDGLLSHFTTQL